MYNTLSIITILVFIVFGKIASTKSNCYSSTYWKLMVIPILSYAITYGLRDGWLIDFEVYKDLFKHIETEEIGDHLSILTYYIFYASSFLGLSYNTVLFVLNALLVGSYCGIIYRYRSYTHWILPFFYCVTFMASQFIAFYPAIGVFGLFMVFYSECDNKFDVRNWKNNKLWLSATFLLIAFGLHKAIIVALPLYVICLLLKFNIRYIIPLYAISFFFVGEWWLNILDSLSLLFQSLEGTAFDRYTIYTSDFFQGTHEIQEKGDYVFSYVRLFFANSTALFFYYKYLCESQVDRDKDKILELSSIALILGNMTQGVQLFERFALVFNIFLPILYAIAFGYGIRSNKVSYKILSLLMLMCIIYYHYHKFMIRDISGFNYIF